MYFDPLTSWIVALLADGVVLLGEYPSDSKMIQYYKKRAIESNAFLNAEIRRRLGAQCYLADSEVRFIHRFLNDFKNRVEYRYCPLELDPDVQKLIINLYIECIASHTKTLHQYEESYKNSKNVEHKARLEGYISEEKRTIAFCQQILTAIEEYRKRKEGTEKRKLDNDQASAFGCFTLLLILFAIVILILLVFS